MQGFIKVSWAVDLLFSVLRFVDKLEEVVVIAVRKQIVSKNAHEGWICFDLGWILLQEGHLLIDQGLINFL